ncbi:Ubiquitin domain-containing protein 2 [Nowakowskiella sp. JEL0407]|nr:Ubiquitin domain-containing protein 2 [Nowakowskiella sp. JEL0407]
MGICSSRNSALPDGHTNPLQRSQPQTETIPGIAQGGNKPLRPWKEISYTHPTPLSRTELSSLRDAFWDTSPAYSGKPEIWQALKIACECPEISSAQTYIDTASISVPTGNLSDGCYDELGNQYIIPAYCFVDPVNLVDDVKTATSSNTGVNLQSVKNEDEKSGNNVVINAEEKKNLRIFTPMAKNGSGSFGITIRLSTAKDIKMSVMPGDNFSTIRKLVEEEERPGWEKEKKKYKLRFFHLGKQMEDRTKVKDTKITDGGVVQVMVVPLDK